VDAGGQSCRIAYVAFVRVRRLAFIDIIAAYDVGIVMVIRRGTYVAVEGIGVISEGMGAWGASPPPKPSIMDNIFLQKRNQHMTFTIYHDTYNSCLT